MKLSEALLKQYAQKILGFAYEKTGNSYEAEDLSQEILLQLISSLNNKYEIEHLNSFLYTVCCYTWSKYLRKNKKHWNYAELDLASDMTDNTNIEQDTINKLFCEKLRKAISSLAKTQREIIIMHYYENKTTTEISNILDINDNTVRWYLGNIRKDLKEKITMTKKNLDVRPLSLCIGIDGYEEDVSNRRPLMEDLLVQNIAIACYGEPVSVTEVSEKLNVAAAYLERHLEQLTYMDFLKKTGNKYQTNFFIKDNKIMTEEVIYGYENAGLYADQIYDAVMARRDDILAINYFNKEDTDPDCFMWYILLKTAQELAYEQMFELWRKCNLTDRPLRKDGSKYWIIANIQYEHLCPLDDIQRTYATYRICYGYKSNSNHLCELHQADTYLLHPCDLSYRDITEPDKMIKLAQIITAIQSKKEFTSFEKIMISEFIEKGYISIKNGKHVINIPVLTEKQMKKLETIISEIKDTLGQDFLKDYILGFGRVMEPLIPKFLHKNIRNYHKYAVMGGFDIFAHLIREAKEGGKCQLKLPDSPAAKYAMTILVLKKETSRPSSGGPDMSSQP